MNRINEPTASDFTEGVPLQNTEDHLGRLLGRESEQLSADDLTRTEERDLAIDEDDESMLDRIEVENAEDDALDADTDDSTRANKLTPEEISDSISRRDLLDNDNESRSREGHKISPEDRH